MRFPTLLFVSCAALVAQDREFLVPSGSNVSGAPTALSGGLHDVPARAFGVTGAGGVPEAIGPGYAAHFDEQGVDFVPLPAGDGARLHMAWVAVARGDEVILARGSGAVRPEVHGNEVCYRHAAELTERFESRVDGLEHSFVFAQRPCGSGDLVVQIALDTGLTFFAEGPDGGAGFFAEGLGGIAFGGVTGIDADGLAVQGALRFTAGRLEYVLPAAFVDAANYPMVLDPMIGGPFTIGNVPGVAVDDVLPSLAYDAGNARYLVVWNAVGASVTPQILGQFVGPSGLLIGGVMSFGYGYLTPGKSLASIHGVNRFLLGYVDSTVSAGGLITAYLRVRAIDAATGAMSNPILLDSTSSYNTDLAYCAVGGDSRPLLTQHTGMVAWHNGLTNGTKTYPVSVPLAGDPTSGGSLAVLENGNHRDVAITAFGGPVPRWLVAYTSLGTPWQIRVSIVDAAGNVCHGPVAVAGTATASFDQPAVASADGSNFLVAWHNHYGPGLDEIRMRTLTWGGTCGAATLTPGPELALPSSGELRDLPALAYVKDRYVIVWREQAASGSAFQVKAMSLDPTTCVTCGSVLSGELGSSALIEQRTPTVASRYAGGDVSSGLALVCWSNLTIRGRLYAALGSGNATSVGGKCVVGGGGGGGNNDASYSGVPAIGNRDFQLMIASPTVPVLAAMIGFSPANFACGPCTLVPNLDVVIAGPGPVAMPLPCNVGLLGVSFWSQWLLWSPAGCPLVADFGLSSAMRFTIGE